MPEPDQWTFLSFVTESGKVATDDWDTIHDFEAEIAFKTMIKNNRKTKRHTDWPEWRHKMSREAGKAGVVELGFKASGKQYRALCKFSGRMCIIVLCMAYHKGNIWTPVEAVKIATDRAKLVSANKAKLKVIKDENEQDDI